MHNVGILLQLTHSGFLLQTFCVVKGILI